ncbi:DUF2809 domain-containing protein [bacterium (Candidatus Blackallbacteria) CG17_big_fil_post_rev_8_21_14_2_50_48_46]|uniref:DUF2809 domain-containing protein n=1 Tax=bacterium (Candidatus Blackallbacteria) CG17_big_fil_post_rev_8_21_14_2_50_48_46 TaxID=2014261 RepID=A0A2M7G0J4_9BACT|nr:MAG: hypothetical protein COW64_22650 [bacterium (Candidatus Blackallbacteria) CG18_big_fil_WC_8_21_14_2_50_49_26]PIW14752.1 MAG: DUF2809 domain-containing protein [bacterium (Candidatus Blackallbacteria) CG17_big_fil_post_rev_8_21_14_2_50_48_46]PIW50854.1 MAG: DUF2809 domain-containing protein [bacterium (Candidatus Blackallbacteria) CG13_big_fil_rev_8_21_14_2_50_49_14]
MKFKFKSFYFLSFGAILWIEFLIAVFVHDDFVRPFLGDMLVVFLMYCFFQSFLSVKYQNILWGVWGFACGVEFLQALNLVGLLRLEKFFWVRVLIGTTFDWLDILSYTLGAVLILWLESKLNKKQERPMGVE